MGNLTHCHLWHSLKSPSAQILVGNPQHMELPSGMDLAQACRHNQGMCCLGMAMRPWRMSCCLEWIQMERNSLSEHFEYFVALSGIASTEYNPLSDFDQVVTFITLNHNVQVYCHEEWQSLWSSFLPCVTYAFLPFEMTVWRSLRGVSISVVWLPLAVEGVGKKLPLREGVGKTTSLASAVEGWECIQNEEWCRKLKN